MLREDPGDMLPAAWGDVPVLQTPYKNWTDTITYSMLLSKDFMIV